MMGPSDSAAGRGFASPPYSCYLRSGQGALTVLEPNDMMEELSLAYVRAVASHGGFAVEEVRRDRDSIDLHIHARGALGEGPVQSPVLGVQLKSTALEPKADHAQFSFDLKVKNYNDLTKPTLLPEDPARWLTCTEEALVLRRSAYWLSLRGHATTTNVSTMRVHLPRTQVFDAPCVRRLLERIACEEAITP